MSRQRDKEKQKEYNRRYREKHKDPVKEQEKLKLKEEQLARKLEKQKPKPPRWGIKAYWEQHPEIKTRTCTRCGKIRPETEEYFHYIEKESRYSVNCKQCSDMNKRRKKKQFQNPEFRAKQNEYTRNYHKEHGLSDEQRKKYNERYKQYYEEHKNDISRKNKEYRQSHIEEIKEREKIQRQIPENKEKIKERKKAYRETDSYKIEKSRYRHKRRARINGLETSLTAKQWEECKSFFNGCCAYCGKETDITMDHFVPVVNGGELSRDNILPACPDCNSSKRELDFFIWYTAQPFYSKMREKRIIKYLNYKGEGLQQRTLFG